MPDASRRRGEATREEIIRAAHDLFASQGYHGTSMRQIAGRAGIALGGVYNHFPTGKEEVFEAVFLQYHPYREVIPAILEAKGDSFEEIVTDGIQRMLTALNNRPEFLNLLFVEVVEFNSVHAHRLFATMLPELNQVVQRVLVANHERLRPIPPLMILRAYLGLFFSYFLTEAIFSEKAPPEFKENAVEHLIDIFLHGVLKDAGASPDLLAEAV